MNRISRFCLSLIILTILILSGIGGAAQTASAQLDEFPQKNAYYSASPSVVWCGDKSATTTLRVHIVGRTDVSRVWITNLQSKDEENRRELFDNGTNGDQVAGDNIFTLSDVVVPCNTGTDHYFYGFGNWHGDLRLELKNGTQMGNNYGFLVGTVDPKYKGAFEVKDFGDGLSTTEYAFFIADVNHEVLSSYPVSEVKCGKGNYATYQKFYSVMPDDFDFAVLMPGLQIFRPNDLAENVPYAVAVSNTVQNIGWPIFDDGALFGSSGRLRSAIYNTFGMTGVLDHELGHAWMVAVGRSLGIMNETYPGPIKMGHWNKMSDVQGQMGAYYFDDSSAVGHFAYNGDETWRLISNTEVEPYSPMELYLMGLIPSSEVPPVHILKNPDTSDPNRILAESYQTFTVEEILALEGGERVPSAADSQKEFNLAFIVLQEEPFADAAYAYFSLTSHMLSTLEDPKPFSSLAPFHWATGGRATLDTSLHLGLAAPDFLPGDPIPTPTITAMPTETTEPSEPPLPTNTPEPTALDVSTDIPAVVETGPAAQKPGFCSGLIGALGIALVPVGINLGKKLRRR